METAQFEKASDICEALGFYIMRGVGGRIFSIRRAGEWKACKRVESLKAAIQYCQANGVKK